VSYIESQSIPDSVRIKSDAIIKLIKGEGALFALDFIISNNGNVYFLEGNINPGIYWGVNSVEDKVNTKKLIVTIVGELKRRTEIANLGKIKLRLKEPLLPQLKFV
jgi:glutathione synthase/RimK-type ligase-like ATP-grasp enzyme